jgi:type VI secretion system secreted protein VgrG
LANIFDGLNEEVRFAFKSNASNAPSFNVISFEGEEGLSKLFYFDITLVTTSQDVDLKNLLSASATFATRTTTSTVYTPYQGILREVEQVGQVDQYMFCRVVFVPEIWKLSLTKINEVYLDELSIPDLISKILRDNGFSNSDFKVMLKNASAYRKRTFVCQYQESLLNFICRWMEKEGLYFYFEQTSDGAQLAIIDYKEAHVDESLAISYTPRENIQTAQLDQAVSAFSQQLRQVSATIVVQDFDYRQASLADGLKAQTSVTNGQVGQVMFYGDNIRTQSEATRLASVRAQQQECQYEVFNGESPAVGIRSGYFINLSHHYQSACNDKFLITAIHHRGSQVGVVLSGQTTSFNHGETATVYFAKFKAIRASQQFRANQTTPIPTIPGVLSGVIDSEGSGKTAELNDYGQYKVQFLFDLSEKSVNKGSAWVRLAAPYSGSGHGMHFPLLKGTEVLVAFSGGDPDQPVIVGSAANSENPNVVIDKNAQTNGFKTVSGNLITLEDDDATQGITIHSPSGGNYLYMGQFPKPKKDS